MLLDPRAGSNQFLKPLEKLGVPVEFCRLDAGDCAFAGSGPDAPLIIGVEIKRVHEVVETVRSGRFVSQQLPHMLDRFDQPWLLVYGEMRTDDSGRLLLPSTSGRFYPAIPDTRTSTVRQWLVSIEVTTSVRVEYASTFDEAVQWLAALWEWWQRPWDSHSAARKLYQPAPRSDLLDVFSTRQDPATLLRRLAAQLPGVGWSRSAVLAKRFGSVEAFTAALHRADPRDWICSEARIGEGIASKIAAALKK